MNKRIVIEEYNSVWPSIYQNKDRELKEYLNADCTEIHHIGSTAVPGLIAKPEIDIICVLNDLNTKIKLINLGYIDEGEMFIPLRFFYSFNNDNIKINLHVVPINHPFINLNISFRTFLLNNPKYVKKYGALKQQLLQDPDISIKQNSSFSKYTLAKNEFIKKILSLAHYKGLNINECLHYHEWQEYHRIKKMQLFEPKNIIYDSNHCSISDTNFKHLILYKNSTIVSIAMLEFISSTEVILRSLATDTGYQKRGYAKYLLTFIEKWLYFNNYRKVFLHSVSSAAPFYYKCNYKAMQFDDNNLTNRNRHIDLGKDLYFSNITI